MTNRELLADMVQFLRKAQDFTADGHETFVQSEMAQFAVAWAFQTAGEIAKRLPTAFRDAHTEINWRQLISFRDFLAHNYERIEVGPLWAAVDDLPQLIPTIQALYDSLPDDNR